MSEMIERVAEALFNCEPMHEKVRWADLFRVEGQPTGLIESYRRRARIAIEAMQEATEPMTAATANDMPAWKAEATFRTMIRAALAD